MPKYAVARAKSTGRWSQNTSVSQSKLRNSEGFYNDDNDTDLTTGSNTCSRNTYQRAIVSVPIAVKPFSFAGPTKTFCCSDPTIKNIRCTGSKEEICYFTISQEICVEIPIHFGAQACAGPSWIDCLDASTNDCDDCDDHDDCADCK